MVRFWQQFVCLRKNHSMIALSTKHLRRYRTNWMIVAEIREKRIESSTRFMNTSRSSTRLIWQSTTGSTLHSTFRCVPYLIFKSVAISLIQMHHDTSCIDRALVNDAISLVTIHLLLDSTLIITSMVLSYFTALTQWPTRHLPSRLCWKTSARLWSSQALKFLYLKYSKKFFRCFQTWISFAISHGLMEGKIFWIL